MAKKIRTKKDKKALGNKIAEIIWTVLAGVVFVSGIVFGIMGLIIESISGNFTTSPFYSLITAQDSFFTWIKTWWSSYPNAISQFSLVGLILMFIGLVFLLLVLLVFSNKQEALDKKEKARKLRENNVRKFEEQLNAKDA